MVLRGLTEITLQCASKAISEQRFIKFAPSAKYKKKNNFRINTFTRHERNSYCKHISGLWYFFFFNDINSESAAHERNLDGFIQARRRRKLRALKRISYSVKCDRIMYHICVGFFVISRIVAICVHSRRS